MMSNATQDAAFVREAVQATIIQNYIIYSTFVVLAYGTGKPSLIYPNLSDSELVLSLAKEVRLQLVQLRSIACLQ